MTHLSGAGPVIVVDDDELDVELLTTFFGMSGLSDRFVLLAFREGGSFLEHMERVERGDEAMPSIILLDINMPRMDGFEVLEQLRSHPSFAELPAVMFLSNSDSPRDIERCTALGAGFQEKFDNSAACIAFLDSLDPTTSAAHDQMA